MPTYTTECKDCKRCFSNSSGYTRCKECRLKRKQMKVIKEKNEEYNKKFAESLPSMKIEFTAAYY